MTAPADVAGAPGSGAVAQLEAAAWLASEAEEHFVGGWLDEVPSEMCAALSIMLHTALGTARWATERGRDLSTYGLLMPVCDVARMILWSGAADRTRAERSAASPDASVTGSRVSLGGTADSVAPNRAVVSCDDPGTAPETPATPPPGDPDGLGVPTAGSGATDGPDGLSGARGVERGSGGGGE